MSKFLVIGGVAGGASTAARLRRMDEHAEIILFERGNYISYANCGLPYYAGEVISERDKLFVMTPERFAAWLAVDVRVRNEVLSIDRTSKTVHVRDLSNGKEYDESYDTLVLSPGADPVKPPIPGIDLEGILSLRSVDDIDKIKDVIDTKRPKRALVIGGGFIGLEMAENLYERGVFVTLVEALPQVMNPMDPEMAAQVHQALKDKQVELYLGSAVQKFSKKEGQIAAELSTGEKLLADMVILSIGVRPEGALAQKAGLSQAKNGAIIVDEFMRTDDPAIYALGDAIAFKHPVLGFPVGIPLAGPANKQARIVADNIVKGPNTRSWKGAIGTSIAKVFSITAAVTGLNEKVLKANNIPCMSVTTHGNSHAGYYPGALPLTVKTIFDPESGRLYGAQVVGWAGVDKRIDVLATFVQRAASVLELAEFEHAYAPPFASAKDPVNINGMVAENRMHGLSNAVFWDEIALRVEQGAILVDVRSPEEFELGTIPTAVNIPLDNLRDRLGEIPSSREVIVFCAVGLRGYLAERIFRQRGYEKVFNLDGGYKTWISASADQTLKGIYVPGRSVPGLLPDNPARYESFSEGSGLPEHALAGPLVEVDACGLQCPGPIMRLKAEMDRLQPGGRLSIKSSDPGFARDAPSWANMTGNTLLSLNEVRGVFTAVLEKAGARPASIGASATAGAALSLQKAASLIVFSDDLDKALAGFVLANGAAAAGKQVTMFFTFWGLSAIKRPKTGRVKKDFMGRMFGLMLPRHAGKLSLSKMNMGGLGASLMRGRMKAKKVEQLEQMIIQARQAGVHMVACQMSMDIMGVKHEELLDGVEVAGVASYMETASKGNVNLFI